LQRYTFFDNHEIKKENVVFLPCCFQNRRCHDENGHILNSGIIPPVIQPMLSIMKYYLLFLLIFPLIIGGLELRIIIKDRKRAREKRKSTRRFKHFKETGPPFGVRKIKVTCQDEAFLKELVCATFDLEWESLQREYSSDNTFLFTLPMDISYPDFCQAIQFMRDSSLAEKESCYCKVTGWYFVGRALLDKEEAPFSNSMLMMTVPEWDEECYVYVVTKDNVCYRHEMMNWGTLYELSDVNLLYIPMPGL
jgi:hypothetical protein